MTRPINDRYLHHTARKSLIRLFRDSMNFNMKSDLSIEEMNRIEDEIVEDFLIVMDYIKMVSLAKKSLDDKCLKDT